MFTGIVEEMGRFRSARGGPGSTRMVFDARTVIDGTTVGDSIAVNGCCLTVVEIGDGWWAADAVEETMVRTNLGDLGPGAAVNLERSLRLADRVGGHLVQGHVDGVGTVSAPAPGLDVCVPDALERYVVEKGSITIDGVSLTVVGVDTGVVSVAIVPHTSAVTTLGLLRVGELVNLEVDIMAKHVERLLAAGVPTPYARGAQ